MLEFLLNLDRELFLFLNGLHVGFLDMTMYYISYKYTWIPLYGFLAALLIIKYRWKSLGLLVFIVILITLSDQLSVAFKEFFERLRPCHEPDLAEVVHLVKGKCGGRFGFVSSHATNSFALAMFMGKVLNDRFKFVFPILLIWAFLNAYSRIYLGVHYPGDVLFGTLLGIAIGLVVYFLWLKSAQLLSKPEKALKL